MEEITKSSETAIKVKTPQPDRVEELSLETIEQNIKSLEDLMAVHQADLDIWLARQKEAEKLGIKKVSEVEPIKEI